MKSILLTLFVLPRVDNFSKLLIIGYHGKNTALLAIIMVLIFNNCFFGDGGSADVAFVL